MLIVVLAIFGVYLGYRYFTSEGPPKEFDYYREHVLEAAVSKLASEVAGTQEKPRKLLLAGDPDNRITYVIKSTLEKSGQVELVKPKFTEDAGQSVKDWFFSEVRKILKPDEAKVLAERSRADAILYAVGKFTDTDEELHLVIDYELQDSASGKLTRKTVESTLGKSLFSLTYLRLWMWSSSRWMRCLLWFLAAIFTPLVTYKLAWAVLAKGRNDYNAMLIAGYTALDTLLAWILLGFSTSGFVASALFIMALLGSGAWNFLILDELEDMRH